MPALPPMKTTVWPSSSEWKPQWLGRLRFLR
jgi:hypothetical protein